MNQIQNFLNEASEGINIIKLRKLLEARNEISKNTKYTTFFPPVNIGSITLVDQVVLLSLLELTQPKKIIEIGTFLGFTTSLLAMNYNKAEIFTIDLPRKKNNSWKFKKEEIFKNDSHNDNYLRNKQNKEGEIYINRLSKKKRKNINLIKQDSRKLDFKKVFGNSEFIFIDGGHSKEIIKADTKNARSIVKNGVIIWHDYGSEIHKDVTKFLTKEKSRKIFHVSGSLCAFEFIGYEE